MSTENQYTEINVAKLNLKVEKLIKIAKEHQKLIEQLGHEMNIIHTEFSKIAEELRKAIELAKKEGKK